MHVNSRIHISMKSMMGGKDNYSPEVTRSILQLITCLIRNVYASPRGKNDFILIETGLH